MKWIDCGLTWDKVVEYDRPEFPDVTGLEQETFGVTQKEILAQNEGQFGTLLKGNFNSLGETEQRERALELGMVDVYEALMLYRSITKWKSTLPILKDYEAECNRRHDLANAPTFVSQKLNVPGVEVEIGGHRYLIGHVNDYAGDCGCCTAWDAQSIVTRYRVLIDYSKMED